MLWLYLREYHASTAARTALSYMPNIRTSSESFVPIRATASCIRFAMYGTRGVHSAHSALQKSPLVSFLMAFLRLCLCLAAYAALTSCRCSADDLVHMLMNTLSLVPVLCVDTTAWICPSRQFQFDPWQPQRA
eukprot:TRINITY_DN2246_c0_g1_i20.p1 TRINITY_DN2246_c0_g1~~TRINITY_DN2246_c0_g1_i20.p1  ORF type:complete len:133 (-),score=8.61 TRINITY_DN2246_c0_g1_i20:71-469(-)